MNRRVEIMLEPCTVEERFEHTCQLIQKTYDKYHGTIFELNSEFWFTMNVYFDEQYYIPRTGGSIIRMTGSKKNPEDEYVKRSEEEFRDFYMMNSLTRYFNWCLLEVERASICGVYFKDICEISRKDIMEKYSISKRKYYTYVESGKEKLIEAWALDGYGGPEDDYYGFLGRKYVQWKRTKRTGIEGGYIGEHPEWVYMFIEKDATMMKPGGNYKRPAVK